MRYFVTIGERTFEVEIRDGVARVGGLEAPAVLPALAAGPLRRLEVDGRAVVFAMTRAPGGWELIVNGEAVHAAVVDERTSALEQLTSHGGPAGGLHVIRAPMPGMVVRVEIELGAVVRAGEGLVVLEAMKMENELTAPVAGRVVGLPVTAGHPVEKGATLVEVAVEG